MRNNSTYVNRLTVELRPPPAQKKMSYATGMKQGKVEVFGNNNFENDKQTRTTTKSKQTKKQKQNPNPETNPINLSGELREDSSGLGSQVGP